MGDWSIAERQAPASTMEVGVTTIIDAIDEGVVAVDRAWCVQYLNSAAAYLLGLDAPALLGQPLLHVLGLTSEALLAPEGHSAGFSLCCARPGAWLELRSHVHAKGGLVFLRDVSLDRDAHLAGLAEARAREARRSVNEGLFATSLDLILVANSQGDLIRISPSSRAILGYGPEEMAGRSAIHFIHPDDLEATRAEMRAARRGRVMRQFDCRYMHKDGRAVSLHWTGVWSAVDAQHFFIGRDLTERLAAEERVQRSQRLEAIGQLTGGIAHDFNNLLGLVISSLELLLDRTDLAEDTMEHAAAALHGAQRGADLVRGLLAFARQQPLEPRTVDANALLGNTARLLGRMLGGNIVVEFDGAADLWPVHIDAPNLESAIVNLAVNARDAMPDGGRLTLSTRNATLGQGDQHDMPGFAPGDYVAVTATDTGAGIPPEVMGRIFDPFFTTKEPGRGTGLGLSMVFGFVKQSGGHIHVDSVVGRGTSVRLYLPRAVVEDSADEQAAAAAQSTPAARERILVVEDNAAVRQIVLVQLRKLGYATMEADRASAALALLDAGEPFDLLFTDLAMPGGISGQALAREALSRRGDLKVLFTSGLPGTLAGVEGGADAILAKPYRIDTLARKIRQVLDS
ncbi:MAG: PAS domain S-box protein [Alphaproteobacteria bacterium]|nr:PAS domain S-box protein [Alphaproteobacteria bacterium]MCW5738711.1 PAS domain S-box protein [Alphaproteobacteria bacterium]